jgi:putative FmdB family regulatory protein
MPIYEYWCPQCCRRFSIYLPSFSASSPPCPECGKSILERRFSTFSVARTSNDVYEGILGDTQLKRGMLRNDPKALAEWNRRMGGDDKVAPEYEEMVQRLEHGEMPPETSGGGTEKTEESPS